MGWEAEGGVGTPVARCFLEDGVAGDQFEVRGCYSFAQPGTLHLPPSLISSHPKNPRSVVDLNIYLRSRHSPNLKIIRPHKRIRNADPIIPQNPVIEILRLGITDPRLERRIDHPLQTHHLVVFGQHGNVVLEGVGDPEALVADVGDALVVVPVAFVREGFVDAVVEVFVVREDYVAADVVELGTTSC